MSSTGQDMGDRAVSCPDGMESIGIAFLEKNLAVLRRTCPVPDFISTLGNPHMHVSGQVCLDVHFDVIYDCENWR